MLSTSFFHCDEIVFHSLSTTTHIFIRKCVFFPYREQEIIHQIFSIGFKSGLWSSQNISSNEFSTKNFLLTFAVCVRALSNWNIIVSVIMIYWTVGRNSFSSILMYSFKFINPSHLISLPTTAAVKTPYAIIPPFSSFTVVLMQLGWYFSPNPLIQTSGTSLERQNRDSSDQITLLNYWIFLAIIGSKYLSVSDVLFWLTRASEHSFLKRN